jgi:hypothetical protein
MHMPRRGPSKSNTAERTLHLSATFALLPLMSGEVALVGESTTIAT